MTDQVQMDAGLDTGDMLLKGELTLDEEETGGSLFNRLSSLGAGLLVEALEKLEQGTLTPEKQPEESPTPYAAQISKAQGEIDWGKSTKEIERLIRGLDPVAQRLHPFKWKDTEDLEGKSRGERRDRRPGRREYVERDKKQSHCSDRTGGSCSSGSAAGRQKAYGHRCFLKRFSGGDRYGAEIKKREGERTVCHILDFIGTIRIFWCCWEQ